MRTRWTICFLTLGLLVAPSVGFGDEPTEDQLERRFTTTIQPFLKTYCVDCHGKAKPEAEFDLSGYSSMTAVLKDSGHLRLLLQRIRSAEMPPDDAKSHPSEESRREVVEWFRSVIDRETRLHAGDPGVVLARRLSNSEYDNTIRDLTGFDLRPTREFPVDPANTAGFDNSGESLTMSPALLNKYLKAAHEVADHLFLKPNGFAFEAHPMIVETDRDKHCVQQIIDFYHRQKLDYADYFEAAWRFQHRAKLGKAKATLSDFAAENQLSPKYLATIRATLEAPEEVGPLVKLQARWKALPEPVDGQPDIARNGCEAMRDYVIQLRQKVEPRFLNLTAGKLDTASQPLLIWKNRQYATHRMTFDPAQLQVEGEPPPPKNDTPEPGVNNEFGPGKTRLIHNAPGDPDLVVPAGQREKYEAAFGRFCRVFPDKFLMEERGRNYFDTTKDRGRYLNAGFHSLMGYFRDDQPLYELILDEAQQKELDAMWLEMDFVGSATARMYTQFNSGPRRLLPPLAEGQKPEVVGPEREITSEPRIQQSLEGFLARAKGGDPKGIEAIREYFAWINATVRSVEKARLDAEPSHLWSLLKFAERAYRRPLTKEDQDDLLSYYARCRKQDGLDHESAIRETIVSILISPDLCYRVDLLGAGKGVQPLSDDDLASRLSYFLWSSPPDDELLAHASVGDLHEPLVIAVQAKRMLKDPRIRALAIEFGGNWLDYRRFEGLGTVDRDRFPSFNDELRSAMFEEPVRLLMDTFQNNRSVLDFIYGNDTFVNPSLARHYGMPVPAGRRDEWVKIDDAAKYGRGGLLPMAVFLTKNSPGLRTSPVKRGNWVVKNILGERIPPPPPTVPEIPQDEAKLDLPLREILARHRADVNCAACHAKFDSLGLVFEGFGPIGEVRKLDLAGRAVDTSATFPGSIEGSGLEGLRKYIRDHRQDEFVDNFSGKMVAYALGRSLIPADDLLIREIHAKLEANGYRFDSVIETIVTSRPFLNKRGHDDLPER